MNIISIFENTGAFAENKDVARVLRVNAIIPAIEREEDITLDFERVEAATQSFVHALLSEVIRSYGSEVLERISFKSCNINVQKIIEIVVEYMQEGMGIERGNSSDM